MEFGVLGPLEVLDARGRPVRLASAPQRRLVSLLVLGVGTPRSADFLADCLRLSPGALRTAVSRLRRQLGEDVLVTAPPGYLLRADRMDVREFESLVATARSAPTNGDASASLWAALGLWRGDAYAEFAHEPWAIAEARRLSEARATATEDLAELLIADEKWAEAIQHLEVLIGQHPLRDRPRIILMRALAGSGRRAEALRVFQDYRNHLIEETGTEPAGIIVSLEQSIARAGPTNDWGTVTFLLTALETYPTEVPSESRETDVATHYAVLDRVISDSGGIRPLAQGEGATVISTFTSADDALCAAVAAQRALAAELPNVRVRMGLHTSTAQFRGSERYVGGALSEGERLRDLGHGGQILVSKAAVEALDPERPHGYQLVEAGIATLRPSGMTESVWHVVASGLRSTFPPLLHRGPLVLPAALRSEPVTVVVGRDKELAALERAADRVTQGEGPEVALISGEPGVGKTTVLAEAARRASARGACVLYGHCEEDLAAPYQLFAEALGGLARWPDSDRSRPELARIREWERLVAPRSHESDAATTTSVDAEEARHRLFASVVDVLGSLAEDRPLVLAFDDLQWADPSSMQLLCHLVRSRHAKGVLVLATCRSTDRALSDPLTAALANLHRVVNVVRVDLEGLKLPGVESLMTAATGQSLDPESRGVAHDIWKETDGNPLFVREMVRHLVETGRVGTRLNGRQFNQDHSTEILLPSSLREVILARVGRLDSAVHAILSVASVIGHEFDLDVLAGAAAQSPEVLIDALDAAGAAGLVQEPIDVPGTYRFTHALIQRVVYRELGRARRREIHRRVAQTLDALCVDHPESRATERARHWSLAPQPVSARQTLLALQRAGGASLAALAPDDALDLYQEALRIAGDARTPTSALSPGQLRDLTIGLGTAQCQTGRPEYRDTLLAAARAAAAEGDDERLVKAALACDRGFFSVAGSIDAEKVAILEMALNRLAPSHPARPLILANLCQELTYAGPLRRRRALAEEALELARSDGGDAIFVRVSNCVFDALRVPSELDDTLARTAEALRRAARLDDTLLYFWAAVCRHEAAANAGDIGELDRCMALAESLADALDQPTLHWVHTYHRASRALLAGDTERLEELATTAFDLGLATGQPDATTIFAGQMFVVAWHRGDAGGLIPTIERFSADNPGISFAQPLLAVSHAEGGRRTETLRFLDKAAESGFALQHDLFWTTGICAYAEAATVFGTPEHAASLFDLLEPFADQCGATGATTTGPISRYLGGLATVLGRYEEAERYFADAAVFCREAGANFYGIRTDLWWSALLLQRRAPGDRQRATSLLRSVQGAAAGAGYRAMERSAAESLALAQEADWA